METSVEKDCSALGGLFQIVINDMKAGVPMWEDFLSKATKLHSQLKATVIASTAFLDAFQKVADLATSTKGATKDIGTALTRLCLRHRSVEARLKTFTSSIIDCLVLPLQDKIEDWKKTANQLDKDHSKEYKRARQEIKKKSSDTLRLQKKVRKGMQKGKGDFQRSFDCALQDVSDKYLLLEETEKQAVRKALIEERSHFCLLVSCLKPVVEEELSMLQEITHLQEIVDALSKLTADPYTLPLASEQVIADIKGSDSNWSFQTPPSSPSSLGSRKSSMCSISSFNSSSSGSSKSHSPSHHYRHRSLSQQPTLGALRLSSISSQDSGFTSQDTLFSHLPNPPATTTDLANEVSSLSEHSSTSTSSTSSIPSSPYTSIHSVTGTWPNLQDTVQFERAAMSLMMFQRPHTISTAYERVGHNRPPLTSETFHPPNDDYLRGTNMDDVDATSSEENLVGSGSFLENYSDSRGPEAPPAHHVEINPPLPSRSVVALEKPSLPDKPIPTKQEPPAEPYTIYPNAEENHIYANASDISSTLATKSRLKGCMDDPEKQNKKLSQQKEFAALLNQSLRQQLQQNQRRDSEGNMFIPESKSVNDDKSQSLSDSEEMASLSKILDSMSKYMEECGVVLRNGMTNNTHRPVSVVVQSELTGVSVGNIHPQEKYGSLHRSASQTNKPPPPVRRNSSLSSTSINSPTTVKSATLQRLPSSCSSSSTSSIAKQEPAMTISPGLVAERTRRFKQNEENAAVGGNVAREVHHVQNQNGLSSSSSSVSENCQSPANMIPNTTTASVPNNTDEMKAFTSHAQFIQTLNARLSQQPTLSPRMLKRRSLSLPHGPQSGEWLREVVLNAREDSESMTSSQEILLTNPSESIMDSSKNASPNSSRKLTGHAHTLNSCERESLIQSLNAKFSQKPPGGSTKLQRKPSAPNILPPRDRTSGSFSPPIVPQRRSSQPNLSSKQPLQIYRADGSDDEKYDAPNPMHAGERISRQNFLEALNAKLAQQHYSHTLPVRRGSSVDRYESSNRRSSGDCGPKQDLTHAKESRVEACGAATKTTAAAKVHNWLAGRGTVDIASCRESLMDQIRQGATLRKATSNDRSAPKLS